MGAITKTGDVHARTLLIEAAHCYRFPARIARHKLATMDAVPDAVRASPGRRRPGCASAIVA